MNSQILKTGVANANMVVGENLFRMTPMDAEAQATFTSSSDGDWTKYFRYYNGSAARHSFSNGIDTITLQSGSNIGIAFQRKATDINLDSTAYYTISCEAKCEVEGAKLSIGLSYYNTSGNWYWAGGSNLQAFNAVDTWQKFTLKFKPSSATQYTMYCFTINSTTDKHFSIRHCKLEKGEVATPWIPNELDSIYIGTSNGFNESMVSAAKIYKGLYEANQFYEI